MSKYKFNTKGLGLKQLQLLNKMAKEKLVIRVISSNYGKEHSIELQDEGGDNSYEDVSYAMMESLGKRRLFECFGWMPALFTTIDTYRLKRKTIEVLGLMPKEQEDKRSVATEDDQGYVAGKTKNKDGKQ